MRKVSIFNLQSFLLQPKEPQKSSHPKAALRLAPPSPHPQIWGKQSFCLFFCSSPPQRKQQGSPHARPTRSPRGRDGTRPPAPASGPAACTGLCPPGSPAPGTPAGSAPRRPQPLLPPGNRGRRDTEFPSHPGDAFATSGVKIPGIPLILVPPPSAPPACPQPQFIHFLSLFLALGSAITGFVGFGTLLPKSYNGALFLLKTRGLCSGKGRPRGQRLLVSTGWVFFPPLQQTEGS